MNTVIENKEELEIALNKYLEFMKEKDLVRAWKILDLLARFGGKKKLKDWADDGRWLINTLHPEIASQVKQIV